MTLYTNYKFSSGPAAANLYLTYSNIDYRLCFDWSYDYIYWKVGTNQDIEINLNNFNGFEQIDSTNLIAFLFACEKMIEQTQYYNYNKVSSNRAQLMLLVNKLKVDSYTLKG